MRATIRLLAIVIVVLFVVALVAAISGELAMAQAATQPLDPQHYHGWPGFIQEMVLFAAGMLAMFLFAIMSAFALALQRHEWLRVIATALLAACSVTLTLGMLGRVRLPGFALLGPVLALVLPLLQLLAFVLLVFAPLLADSVVLVRYSHLVRRHRRPARTATAS